MRYGEGVYHPDFRPSGSGDGRARARRFAAIGLILFLAGCSPLTGASAFGSAFGPLRTYEASRGLGYQPYCPPQFQPLALYQVQIPRTFTIYHHPTLNSWGRYQTITVNPW